MRLSRRRFLWAGVAVAASWGVWRIGAPGSGRARHTPGLPDVAPAPLSEATAAALTAAAATVIGEPIDRAHYAEYYRWRAEHLRGYHALYEAFARDVNRGARAAGGRVFADSTASVRRAVLEPARRARDPESAWDRLRAAVGERSWQVYDRYILAEALALFARTDAWVVLGYRGWPGQPRGLDRYRRAPA